MFSLSKSAEYADVFLETNYTGSLGNGLLIIVFSLFMGLLTLGVFPGLGIVPEKVSKVIVLAWSLATLVVAGIGTVTAISDVVTKFTETNKIKEVVKHMEENVEKKYGAKLVVSWEGIPAAEDRDEPHDYTLLLNKDDENKRVRQQYLIRFDRETSEPFVSNIEAPTAEQLETAAK